MGGLKSDPQLCSTDNAAADSGVGLFGGFMSVRQPKLRFTSEYDSETSVFLQKVSCKIFDNLAKLKLSLKNNMKGEVSDPQVYLTSKFFLLHYDVEENDALLKSSLELAPGLQFKVAHTIKDRLGEVAMVADLAGPDYKFELSSNLPSIGMPRATIKFPLGEVSFEKSDQEVEEEKKTIAVNGIIKGHILNGLCSARYSEDNLDLRYSFKDEQLTVIPRISLPSNTFSCAFKRRFSPSNKLSYLYHFDSDHWSMIYKHLVGKDYKFKAGYDSEPRVGWASLWVGDEEGKAKAAPMKMKVQVMLQVPQDDKKTSALMFRVKKRWDI